MTGCRRLATITLTALAALWGGCEGPDALETITAERDRALAEADKLRKELAKARRDLAARQQRIQTLLGLGEKRLEKLYVVQRIRIGRATSGDDLDAKSGDDAVKVYLEPIDQHGSVLKAPGEVTIQLYDLAAPAAENLVGEYHFDLDQTAAAWFSGFVAYYYRFTCRWAGAPPRHEELTVRVEFLDYLTGRKHTAQALCTVALPPPAATQPGTRPAK